MNVLLGLRFSTLVVCHVSALECYNCLMGCNDEFKAAGVSKITCTGSCRKTKADGHVQRTCFPFVKIDECKEEGDSVMCTCTTDLCNGATNEYMSTFGCITIVACVVLNIFRRVG